MLFLVVFSLCVLLLLLSKDLLLFAIHKEKHCHEDDNLNDDTDREQDLLFDLSSFLSVMPSFCFLVSPLLWSFSFLLFVPLLESLSV